MSHRSNGVVLTTASGKFVRVYKSGKTNYLQETPDICCATIFRDSAEHQALAELAERTFDEVRRVKVEVLRTVRPL